MPLAFIRYTDRHSRIALWKINESEDSLIRSPYLPEDSAHHIEAIKHPVRRLQWLASRIMVGMLTGSPDNKVGYDEQGKPFLQRSPWNISITHSGHYAALSVSEKNETGIDIESVSERIEKVAQRFLSDEELQFVGSTDRALHLTACWAAKEALFKLNGIKTHDYRAMIQLAPFTPDPCGYITGKVFRAEGCTSHLLRYESFDGYLLAYIT